MSGSYPSWLPEPVDLMARALPDNAVKDRLVCSPSMEVVWNKLIESRVREEAYSGLWGCYTLRSWDISDYLYSLAQKSAAAMLSKAVFEFLKDGYTKTSEIDKDVQIWRDVALRCRTIHAVDNAPLGNEELSKALSIVAEHFDCLAERFANVSGPRVIGRSGRQKTSNGSDETRHKLNLIRVRSASIIAFADALYMQKHRKVLATFCSVGLDHPVSPKDIENYRNMQKS